MKTYFLLRIAATILFALTLYGCTRSGPALGPSTGILIDVSEGCQAKSVLIHPGLAKFCQLDHEKGATVKVATVSDRPIPVIRSFQAGPASWWDNPHEKSAQRQQLADSLANYLDTLPCQPGKFTYLYASIVHLVGDMQKRPACKYRFVMATDGQEHHSQVSFATSKAFIQHPQQVMEKLEEEFGPLPDMSGFEVRIISQTQGIAEFRRLAFWQDLFESRGASVWIAASL